MSWLVMPRVLTPVCVITVELNVLVLLIRPHRPILVRAWHDSPPPSVVSPSHDPRNVRQQSLGASDLELTLFIATRPTPVVLRSQAMSRVIILTVLQSISFIIKTFPFTP